MMEHDWNLIFQAIADDIAELPDASLPLVGALIVIQKDVLPTFQSWLLAELSKRCDLTVVSPAAEAVMRLNEFGIYRGEKFADEEINAQFSLLKALNLIDALSYALEFISKLATRLEVCNSYERASQECVAFDGIRA